MSKKSLGSILKCRILDGGLAVVDRKKALRDLPRPSRRFLQRLIDSTDTPPELRRAASRMLVKLLSVPKPKPVETSPLSVSEPQEEVKTAEMTDPEVQKRLEEIFSAKPLAAKPAELLKPTRTAVLRPEGLHD